MGKIFVTSDLHFGHNKDFIYSARGFNSIEEHDAAIIANWNSIVSPEDTVYILGDLMLRDNVSGLHNFNQLNGNKIVVFGNHDTDNRIDFYRMNGIKGEFATRLAYGKYNFFLSHFPCICGEWGTAKERPINLCGHVHTSDPFYDASKGKIYHCELDAHNMYPVLIEDIIQDIKNYEVEWRKVNERNQNN